MRATLERLPDDTAAARSFGRALWAQALFAGSALALASSNPADFSLAASNPAALGAILVAGAFAGLLLAALGRRLSRGAELGLASAAFIFVPIDLLVLESDLASTLSRFLLVLQVAKLLGPRERRDEGTILVVALVHIAVAAASTVELSFLPAFAGYVVTALYALAVRELRGVAGAAAPKTAPVTIGFRLMQGGLIGTVLTLAVLFFVFMPRIGAKLLPMQRGTPERTSGYNDNVNLNASGRIKESGKLAFRAVVIERGRLGAVPSWRGRALDNYDGKTGWMPSAPSDRLSTGSQATPGENNVFDLEETTGPRRISAGTMSHAAVLDIHLEPVDTRVIFTPGVTHKVDFRTNTPNLLTRDALGSIVTLNAHIHGIAYRVVCSPELMIPSYGTSEVAARMVTRCTKLPLNVNKAKLAEYARGVLKAANLTATSPPAQVAHALEEHLATTYHYTLDAKHDPAFERTDEFLFTTKEGHCEIFASTLAVLLRTLDIPSRVVNGFKGGEYHVWSDSYSIRERHAHSWVEAYTAQGWITLDPTPAVALEDDRPGGITGAVEDAREWLEIRWFKNVIAFDSGDQNGIMKWARGELDPKLERLDELRYKGHDALEKGGRKDLGYVAAALAALLVLGTAAATVGPKAIREAMRAWLRSLLTRSKKRDAGSLAARELEALIRALERKGVVRRPGETARELAERAREALGEAGGEVSAIVPFYYEARFGGRELTADERAAIARAAKAVTAAAR